MPGPRLEGRLCQQYFGHDLESGVWISQLQVVNCGGVRAYMLFLLLCKPQTLLSSHVLLGFHTPPREEMFLKSHTFPSDLYNKTYPHEAKTKNRAQQTRKQPTKKRRGDTFEYTATMILLLSALQHYVKPGNMVAFWWRSAHQVTGKKKKNCCTAGCRGCCRLCMPSTQSCKVTNLRDYHIDYSTAACQLRM